MNQNKQEFAGVQDTLFIPLAARVSISNRFPEYFYDKKSLELQDLEQVKKINAKSSEYSAMASVARYYNVDKIAARFLEQHKSGNIINLGAGLETINYRVANPHAHFYSVDFPEVIETRRQILGQAENETLIGCDITDMAWTKQLDATQPALLILSGVFQYFKEEAVMQFLQNVQQVFQRGEMVFDATNEVGIRYAQRYVKKTGNTSAMMYFYINDAEKFAKDAGVTLLSVTGFYDDARKMVGRKTGLYTRIAMKVADEKKRALLLHIKL